VSPELATELRGLPRRRRIGYLCAALVADPTLPKMRACCWLLACILKISHSLSPVEKIALCAVLREDADELISQIEWPPHVEYSCDPR
jgi:hypothetical protein